MPSDLATPTDISILSDTKARICLCTKHCFMFGLHHCRSRPKHSTGCKRHGPLDYTVSSSCDFCSIPCCAPPNSIQVICTNHDHNQFRMMNSWNSPIAQSPLQVGYLIACNENCAGGKCMFTVTNITDVIFEQTDTLGRVLHQNFLLQRIVAGCPIPHLIHRRRTEDLSHLPQFNSTAYKSLDTSP